MTIGYIFLSDPSSIIALPCQSVSPSLLSLNFVPMGHVGLVGPVSLVDLVGMVGLLGLVGLVGMAMGCQVGLVLGTFLLFDLIQKYFRMEILSSMIQKNLMIVS